LYNIRDSDASDLRDMPFVRISEEAAVPDVPASMPACRFHHCNKAPAEPVWIIRTGQNLVQPYAGMASHVAKKTGNKMCCGRYRKPYIVILLSALPDTA
jgi:hypothetical protein